MTKYWLIGAYKVEKRCLCCDDVMCCDIYDSKGLWLCGSCQEEEDVITGERRWTCGATHVKSGLKCLVRNLPKVEYMQRENEKNDKREIEFKLNHNISSSGLFLPKREMFSYEGCEFTVYDIIGETLESLLSKDISGVVLLAVMKQLEKILEAFIVGRSDLVLDFFPNDVYVADGDDPEFVSVYLLPPIIPLVSPGTVAMPVQGWSHMCEALSSQLRVRLGEDELFQAFESLTNKVISHVGPDVGQSMGLINHITDKTKEISPLSGSYDVDIETCSNPLCSGVSDSFIEVPLTVNNFIMTCEEDEMVHMDEGTHSSTCPDNNSSPTFLKTNSFDFVPQKSISHDEACHDAGREGHSICRSIGFDTNDKAMIEEGVAEEDQGRVCDEVIAEHSFQQSSKSQEECDGFVLL